MMAAGLAAFSCVKPDVIPDDQIRARFDNIRKSL